MKNAVAATFLIFALLPIANASNQLSQQNHYSDGVVLKVEKHEAAQMSTGSNGSDAPLADPETFAYDVSVKSNCGTYVGRYESWYDYLPAELAANQKVQLRLTRGRMFVSIPNRRDLQMRIVSRQREHGVCNAKN